VTDRQWLVALAFWMLYLHIRVAALVRIGRRVKGLEMRWSEVVERNRQSIRQAAEEVLRALTK
jgi:hypothetical protein